MQTIDPALATALAQDVTLRSRPHIIAEWNQNRYGNPVASNNSSARAHEPALYPIDSIVAEHRPRSKGIPKAVIGQARIGYPAGREKERGTRKQKYLNKNMKVRYERVPTYNWTPDTATGDERQYSIASANDDYKYWAGPTKSGSASPFNVNNAQPQVVYGANVRANRLVARFETSWAAPDRVDVYVTYNGSAWTQVGSNVVPDADGVISMEYTGAGDGWVHNGDIDSTGEMIRGVRFHIQSMSKANVRPQVIEIAALYVQDITEDVVSFNVNKTREEVDLVLPVGISSANTCSIVLDNLHQRYNPENGASDLYARIEPNVRFTVSLDYQINGVWSPNYRIQQGIFYADTWSDGEGTKTVACTDFAKFLMEEKVRKTLFVDYPAPLIIEELLKRAGHQKANIDYDTDDIKRKIPFVWFKDNETVWEAMQSVAKAMQGAFYFDEFERLQYQSRRRLFKNTVDLAVDYSPTAPLRSNLIDWTVDWEVEANFVRVNYRPLKPRTKAGNKIESILWEPETSIALHSDVLENDMTNDSTWVKISRSTITTMPYKGMLSIQGELMRYDGKEYRYRAADGTTKTKVVNSADERQNTNDDNPSPHRYHNHFTGRLKIVERGAEETVARAHEVGLPAGWEDYRYQPGGSNNGSTNGRGSRLIRTEGRLRLTGGTKAPINRWHTFLRGTTNDRHYVYGTVLRFPRAKGPHGIAGLCFGMQNNHNGYYVEIAHNNLVDKKGGLTKEVHVYRMNQDGTRVFFPNNKEGRKGFDLNVVSGQDYQIEVMQNKPEVSVYINGRHIVTFQDSAPLPRGKWGLFTRGGSIAHFEYIFAYTPWAPHKNTIEEESLQDRITGGFYSDYVKSRVVLGRDTKNTKDDRTVMVFDEFGPQVHEVRDFNVSFSTAPALSQRLYLTNDRKAVLIDWNAGAFGAQFRVANMARGLAVLHGDDPTLFGADKTISQRLVVLGQALVQGETARKETAENKSAQRRRGKVEVDFESPWIQTEDMADDIVEFIEEHWSQPVDFGTLELFAQPHLQVGDAVTIRWPQRDMSHASHKYFVVGISIGFEQGVTQSLTLRRGRV